jgi:hypothetical protein
MRGWVGGGRHLVSGQRWRLTTSTNESKQAQPLTTFDSIFLRNKAESKFGQTRWRGMDNFAWHKFMTLQVQKAIGELYAIQTLVVKTRHWIKIKIKVKIGCRQCSQNTPTVIFKFTEVMPNNFWQSWISRMVIRSTEHLYFTRVNYSSFEKRTLGKLAASAI